MSITVLILHDIGSPNSPQATTVDERALGLPETVDPKCYYLAVEQKVSLKSPGSIERIVQAGEATETGILRGIDRYGSTFFSSQQMPRFLQDWRAQDVSKLSDGDRADHAMLGDLAGLCERKGYVLCFVGD